MPSSTPQVKKAMISSTVRDLPDHRKQVMEACQRQTLLPLMMENLPASDDEAISASLKVVDEADIYIGVFAQRYGYVPAGHALSVTEMEYKRAVERGIPRLIFIMDDFHPISFGGVEMGRSTEKLRVLKEKLKKENFVYYFNSPDELRALVIQGLHEILEREKKTRQKIKIFLASSSELKEDRLEFESFINRENKRLFEKGIFLELVQWEDFLDAISLTSLQDEYNKQIKICDIVVCLFFTKIGKYTAEEFDTALDQFQKIGKPKIFIYFKSAQIDIGDVSDEIVSLLLFRKKLRELGHFPTSYKSIGDLKYHFGEQLKKMDIY